MKFLVLIAVFISSGASAFANFSEITNADMVCVSSGAAYFLDLTEGKESVWQADKAEDTEGLLLEIVEFERLACEHCYDIKANLNIFGGSVPLNLIMQSEGGDITLKALVDPDDEAFEVELVCSEI